MPNDYADDRTITVEVPRRDWIIANVRPAVRELMRRKGLRTEKEDDLLDAVLRDPCTLLLNSGAVEFDVDRTFEDLERRGLRHVTARDEPEVKAEPRVEMPSDAVLAKMTPIQKLVLDEKLRQQKLRDNYKASKAHLADINSAYQ